MRLTVSEGQPFTVQNPGEASRWRDCIRHILFAIAVLLALASVKGRANTPACNMGAADAGWIQQALDGWALVSAEFLRLETRPLPWVVFFDMSCVWHISSGQTPEFVGRTLSTPLTFDGKPLSVRGAAHDGTVWLPNGAEIPVAVKASTGLYRNGRTPFFVVSMPAVWRQDPRYVKYYKRDEYLQAIVIHELTHTRQLVAINRRVREIARAYDLPVPVNDDVVQARFRNVYGFEKSFKHERDLFFRAASEPDAARQRELVRRALEMVRLRHLRYFRDANKPYAELESLFLTMEGAGQWAAYRLVLARARPGEGPEEALNLVRYDRRYWSQEEGLAIFLLLDALVPEWQERIFAPVPASPFALLEEAVARESMEKTKGTERDQHGGAEKRRNGLQRSLEDRPVHRAASHPALSVLSVPSAAPSRSSYQFTRRVKNIMSANITKSPTEPASSAKSSSLRSRYR
jgi:hypothetical protein